MRPTRAVFPFSLLALALASTLTYAHLPPPPAPAAAVPPADAGDAQQLPAFRGEFERYTLTGRGDVDGFILKDGTEVKTSPELATQLPGFFKPGERVTIKGLHAAALPLVRAVSLTNDVTRRALSDSPIATPPPPRPGSPPAPSVGTATALSGRVRLALHGPQGEVNGVLLDNGTILRIPPSQGQGITAFMQARQSISAQGLALTTPAGTVMDVQQLGPSRDKMVAVGPPAPPIGDPGVGGGPRARAGMAPAGASPPRAPAPAGPRQPGLTPTGPAAGSSPPPPPPPASGL